MNKLSTQELNSAINSLNNWYIKNNFLTVTYKLESFMKVMSFANLISDKAEQINHHPKFTIDYNSIVFELTTHDEGGITKLDIELAKFIDETYSELFS